MARGNPRVVIGRRKGIKVRCRELTGVGWISHTYNSISQAKKNNPKRTGARFTCKIVDTGKVVWKR